MKEKICPLCKQNKTLDKYHKDKYSKSGYTSRCIGCRNKLRKEWGKENQDKTRKLAIESYYRNRKSRIERQRKYYSENSDKVKKYQKSYNKLNPKKILKNRQEYRKRNPEKIRAGNIVQNEISRGRLKKTSCEICFDVNSEGHHPDYKRPLHITWLCKKCHSEVHRIAI